jgi:NAD(P)H-nitrite reductase large subunit
MRHVIIGTGPAGVTAAETLKKLDPESVVTMIGDEPEPPYSRMAIPYLLIDQIVESGTYLRKNSEHYKELGISRVEGLVDSINQEKSEVNLNGGAAVGYDRLLIASGSTPVTPPIDGVKHPLVSSCWTLEDARRISEVAKPNTDVVLMGAGFIGCIILEALAKSGANLTVIEMEDRMVPRMMNDTAGNLIKDWCESRGVSVNTSTRVESITEAGRGLSVSLSNGKNIPADLVVSATGVKPNIGFLDGTDIKTDLGILVNRQMQTSDPHIFAAGDVAQGKDFSSEEFSVQAIQPTAVEHGQLAAKNMFGLKNAVHQGSVNMNVLDTLGLISSSFGLWMGVENGESCELLNKERFRYINLQFCEDVLIGATSLGLTEHVGVLRGLIQTKTKLGVWKDRLIEDPTKIMEAYLGSTHAIGHNANIMK